MDGFDEMGAQCVAVATEEGSSLLQKLAGGIIGLLLVAAVLGVLNYFRQDPQRFRKMIMSFVLNEVNVVVSLSFEIWDFAGGIRPSCVNYELCVHMTKTYSCEWYSQTLISSSRF